MKKFCIDEVEGFVSVEDVTFGRLTRFSEFHKVFSGKTRLSFGKDGTGQYVFKELIDFMGENFRLYFRFENDILKSCVIKLVSGIAKGRAEDYPEYCTLQKEVEYLFGIYKCKLKGRYSSDYEWKKVWEYGWGVIILSQEAHSAQVITDITWL